MRGGRSGRSAAPFSAFLGRLEAVLVETGRREPVIGPEQVRRLALQLAQRIELIGEHLENQPCVEHWVVYVTGLQAPIVIVLHQPVIGVLWEGERVYLGYLTSIDYKNNKVKFIINRGGVIEKVELYLEKEETNKKK